MAERVIAPGLAWCEAAGGAVLRAAGDDLLRCRIDGPRLRVDLLLVKGHHGVEVSFQPSAAVQVLADRASAAGEDPGHWEAAFLRALGALAEASGWWRPLRSMPAVGVVGGMAHPLLGALYDRGAAPVGEVPRWAAPLLREPSVAAAAAVAFGRKATRRVVRSLAACLLPAPADTGRPPGLYPLAVALAGAERIAPDHLAAVLEAPGPWRAPPAWPTVDDLTMARRVLRRLSPERAASLLRDGIAAPSPTLFPTLALVVLAGRRLDDPLPGRLDALRAACLAVVPVDPGPPPPRVPAPPARVPRGGPSAPAIALRAPSAPVRPFGADRFTYPSAVRRLHGQHLGDVRLVLPVTTGDLARWGATLHNCLDTFADAVAAQRALLVGVEVRDRLVGCVEVEPRHGRIRQFLGDRNRPLPEAITRPVVRTLVQHGVVRS
jgi:hypothetical protein